MNNVDISMVTKGGITSCSSLLSHIIHFKSAIIYTYVQLTKTSNENVKIISLIESGTIVLFLYFHFSFLLFCYYFLI